jgi:signal transduction histidine kinase
MSLVAGVPPGLHPVQAVYLAILLVAVLGLALMTVWVERGRSTARIRAVIPLNVAAMAWAGVAALELLAVDPTVSRWLVYLRTALSYLTVVLFVYFGTVYSGRSTSVRRPFNACFLAGMALGFLGLVSQPWLGLHFDPLTFTTEPFPYYRTGFGPAWQFGFLWSYVGIGGSLYYLTELLVTSKHRSSRPLVVYSVGIVLGLVPSAVTFVAGVPTLPGYDHTVLGLSIVSVATFTGAWLGMVEIAPISRDRLLGTTGDGLVVCDDDGTVVDHNDEARRFLADSAAIGSPLATAAPALADAVDGLNDRESGTSDTVGLTRDGRQYSVLVSSVTDGETVAGSALLIRDVTERNRNRRELRRQNDQLDEFASSVAHHLRNPLQVASGQTELARAELGAERPEGVDRERLDDLAGALDRMEAIITDLRTLAEQGKSVESTAQVQFDAAVRTAWSHVDTGAATLRVAADGTIQADRSRLLSILENLVHNSVEHGSTGLASQARQDSVEHGSTGNRDVPRPDDSVEHGTTAGEPQSGDGLTVTVRLTDDGFVYEDDGRGIDADHEQLFDYGYTTSSDGTGLGLRIVETMAQTHGWSVRVDPDHDGARFVFSGAVTNCAAAQSPPADNKQ